MNVIYETCSDVNQLPSSRSRNETNDNQPPNASCVQGIDDEMPGHDELPRIDEAQYALIDIIIGFPDGPPWALFDGAMATFNCI